MKKSCLKNQSFTSPYPISIYWPSMKDYYQILGLARGASADEIKKTYRRLAKQYHPDINKNKEAEEKFKEISEAYNVLSDPKQKQQYDMFGQTGFGGGSTGGAGPGGFRWEFRQGPEGSRTSGNADPRDFGEMFGGGGLGDLFNELFQMGGMRSRGPKQRAGQGFEDIHREAAEPVRGKDNYADVEIDFTEAIEGLQRKIRIHRGDKKEELTVKIPAGVDNGSKVRLSGKGDPGQDGGASGDLYLVVHVKPHPIFWREDADIYCEVPLTIYEAALGATVEVPTVDGSAKMKIPEGTAGGQKFRIKGKGAPILGKSNQRGDAYVIVKIVPPKKLKKEARSWLQEWAEKYPYFPRE